MSKPSAIMNRGNRAAPKKPSALVSFGRSLEAVVTRLFAAERWATVADAKIADLERRLAKLEEGGDR